MSMARQAEFPPKGGTTNKMAQSNYSESLHPFVSFAAQEPVPCHDFAIA